MGIYRPVTTGEFYLPELEAQACTTRMLLKCLLLFAVAAAACNGANILVLAPIPSYSHQMPILGISKALAARGHNVTVLTTNPSKVPIANHTEVDVSESYALLRQGVLGINLNRKINPFLVLRQLMLGMTKLTELQLKSTTLKHFIGWAKDVKFDVALYENMFLSSYLALIRVLGSPPVVAVSTFETTLPYPATVGSSLSLAYAPVWQAFTDHMTFRERIMNVLMYWWFAFHRDRLVYPEHDRVISEVFGEGFPTAEEMEKNVSLLMHCASSSVYWPQSLTPNVVKVGATHVDEPKPLPADLEKWVSGAKDGIILFSLGSNMQGTSLRADVREAFLTAFSRLKNYRVVWKWESDQYFPGEADNVLFRKWVPQQDLLAHPKMKLFITQGGLQSLEETVYFEVPVVCIPLFSDQNPNVRKILTAEAGISIDYDYIDSEIVFKAMNEVLHDPKYKMNMQRLSEISKDDVHSPRDKAVWWVEYVIRHKGAKHLRPGSLDLHWSQYYLVDVAAFFVAIACAGAFVVFGLVQKVCGRFAVCPFAMKAKKNQ